MKSFRPMLGANAPENKGEVNFPVIASFKLDGIRAIFHPDLGLVSRSLKPIKNKQLNEKFKYLIEYSKNNNIILDGEFYHHELTFQQITSLVMTEDFMDGKIINKKRKKDADSNKYYDVEIISGKYIPIKFNNPIEFHMFDMIENSEFNMMFKQRVENMRMNFDVMTGLKIVPQMEFRTSTELDWYFNEAIKGDYEGLIIRHTEGHYKFGRSTLKEGLLLKYKPYHTYDAKIISVNERFENTNESFKNELGQSTKRNTVDNKKGTGLAATFTVELLSDYKGAVYDSQELKVTLTGDKYFRKEIWENKDSYIGKWIEFKGMDVGAKDVPRHPIFERFREDK